MTNNLKPGDKFLLPVTFDAFMVDNAEAGPAWVRVCGARVTAMNTYELDALIPASTLTDLQAENARLRTALKAIALDESVPKAARYNAVKALGGSDE